MSEPLTTAVLVATVALGLVAVAARDFLASILSLSGASVALAVYFYLAGAPIAAVFEAVVAAGLVTVLFLFVISLTDTDAAETIAGRKLPVVGLALGGLLGVGVALYTLLEGLSVGDGSGVAFGTALWEARSIDVLAVTVLLFVGVIAVVRLTAERVSAPATAGAQAQISAPSAESAPRVASDGNGAEEVTDSDSDTEREDEA